MHEKHTMSAYVLGAAESFREHLPTKTLSDPFPEGLYLSKLIKAPEEEIKRNQAKGYLPAVGMIMWAVRGVFFTGKYGAQIFCSKMGDMGEGEPWLLLAMFGHTSITLYC